MKKLTKKQEEVLEKMRGGARIVRVLSSYRSQGMTTSLSTKDGYERCGEPTWRVLKNMSLIKVADGYTEKWSGCVYVVA